MIGKLPRAAGQSACTARTRDRSFWGLSAPSSRAARIAASLSAMGSTCHDSQKSGWRDRLIQSLYEQGLRDHLRAFLQCFAGIANLGVYVGAGPQMVM